MVAHYDAPAGARRLLALQAVRDLAMEHAGVAGRRGVGHPTTATSSRPELPIAISGANAQM